MEKIKIYSLIDALSTLQHTPLSDIAEKAIQGICDFCNPVAALVKIQTPDMRKFEKSAGNSTQIEKISQFEAKFNDLDISSAEFVLNSDNHNVLTCATINYPKEHKGIILVLTEPDNPYKHIIRPFIEVLTGNIILALTMRLTARYFNILELLEKAYSDMKHFGVEAVMAFPISESLQVFWVEANNSKQVTVDAGFGRMISENISKPNVKIKEYIQSVWPSKQKFSNFACAEFIVGGLDTICIFAGKFNKDELVFSKFRSIMAEIDQPTGYNDVLQAFKKLKEDHKLIVKGERVAAILETAVAVNHEINNPLTAVLGNTQLLLLQQDQLPDDVIAKIKVIEKSALRIRKVTQKLMTIVEPVTTSYTNGLEMLDIDKSSSTE